MARNGHPWLAVVAVILTILAYAVLFYRLNAYFSWFVVVQYPYWLVGRWMIPLASGIALVVWMWSISYVDDNRPHTRENKPDGWIVLTGIASVLLFVFSAIYLVGYEMVTNWPPFKASLGVS